MGYYLRNQWALLYRECGMLRNRCTGDMRFGPFSMESPGFLFSGCDCCGPHYCNQWVGSGDDGIRIYAIGDIETAEVGASGSGTPKLYEGMRLCFLMNGTHRHITGGSSTDHSGSETFAIGFEIEMTYDALNGVWNGSRILSDTEVNLGDGTKKIWAKVYDNRNVPTCTKGACLTLDPDCTKWSNVSVIAHVWITDSSEIESEPPSAALATPGDSEISGYYPVVGCLSGPPHVYDMLVGPDPTVTVTGGRNWDQLNLDMSYNDPIRSSLPLMWTKEPLEMSASISGYTGSWEFMNGDFVLTRAGTTPVTSGDWDSTSAGNAPFRYYSEEGAYTYLILGGYEAITPDTPYVPSDPRVTPSNLKAFALRIVLWSNPATVYIRTLISHYPTIYDSNDSGQLPHTFFPEGECFSVFNTSEQIMDRPNTSEFLGNQLDTAGVGYFPDSVTVQVLSFTDREYT